MTRHASFALTAGPAAPRAARRTIAERLDGQLSERDLLDAQLVVSELVTNCVQHASAGGAEDVVVDVLLVQDRLRLAVVAPASKQPRRVAGRAALALPLVERLSSSCGVAIDGCRVTRFWSELTLSSRREGYAASESRRSNSPRMTA